MQEEIGLEVVTDGEFRRGSYWGRFVERTEGLEVVPRCSSFATITATRSISPRPTRPRRLRRTHAARARRIRLPARCHHGHGQDHAAGAVDHALSALFRLCRPQRLCRCRSASSPIWSRCSAQEIADLVRAGCRYVQLDEIAIALLCDPAIRERVAAAGGDPDALVDRYIDAINGAVAACPADVVVGVHMCRGNFSGHYLADGGYDVGGRALLRTHPTPITFCSNTTRRAPATSRRCASCRRARAWCWASSAARRPCSKASTCLQRRAEEAAQPYRSRPARDQPAMRLRQQRRRQSAERGR